jgi:hypothetical protein
VTNLVENYDKHFGKLREAVVGTQQKLDTLEAKVLNLATKAGAKPGGLNLGNALKTLESCVTDRETYETEVKALGYTSLAVALKALGQKTRHLVDLPDALRYAPRHWVYETYYRTEEVWKNGKRVPKKVLERGVNARTAQRQRAGLEQSLQELWYLVLTNEDLTQSEKDDYLNSVVQSYKTDTYFNFSKRLNSELNTWCGDTEEEEEETDTVVRQRTEEEQTALNEFRQQCETDGVEYDEEAALHLLSLN